MMGREKTDTKTWNGFLFVLLTALLVGCASYGTHSTNLGQYHSYYFGDVDPISEPYEKHVSYVLNKYGLTETNTGGALRCSVKLTETSVWNYSFRVGLWDGSN